MRLGRATTALLTVVTVLAGGLVASQPAVGRRRLGPAASWRRRAATCRARPTWRWTLPPATTSVRFLLDDVELAEVTDLYARQTKTAPQWVTATDVGWFPGRSAHAARRGGDALRHGRGDPHRRHQGRGAAARARPRSTASGSSRPQPRSPTARRTATGLAAVQPGYDVGGWPHVVVPDSFGAVRDEWNDDAGLRGRLPPRRRHQAGRTRRAHRAGVRVVLLGAAATSSTAPRSGRASGATCRRGST